MPEQIGILLLFLVVVLFNLIAGLLNRRRKRDAAEAERKMPQPPPRSPKGPTRTVGAPRRSDVSAPIPLPTRRRRGMTWRPSDLRRAVVMMTVLGPPRALADERRDSPG